MIAELLPAYVAATEAFDDDEPCELFPEEAAVVANAVAKRRREFTTVRWCARRSLERLGLPPVPVLPGLRGAPGWPQGVVGSMTHCAGYRAAAVARSYDIETLGVDAEPNEPLPPGVLDAIALDQERRWVSDLLRREPTARWDRLLFSAKESVYKAWFPLTRRWLDFDEAVVAVEPREGVFNATLLVDGAFRADGSTLGGFTGRWSARQGLLVTAIVVPAGSRPAEPGAPRAATART